MEIGTVLNSEIENAPFQVYAKSVTAPGFTMFVSVGRPTMHPRHAIQDRKKLFKNGNFVILP